MHHLSSVPDSSHPVTGAETESDVRQVGDGEGEVAADDARALWADAAYDVLSGVARTYRAVTTHKDMSEELQQRTGVHTSQQVRHWIGDVLLRVARACEEQGQPLLSALCVNAQGSVGDTYVKTVTEVRGETPEDGDQHAAKERLECYRAAEAKGIPSGGGTPALTPRLEASRKKKRDTAHAEKVIPVCPHCFTQLPATGVCHFCD